MKRVNFTAIWSVLLIVAGVLFLIYGRSYISVGNDEDRGWAVLWAALFGAGGLSFLWAYFTDRVGWWWTVIPAFIMLGLALIITLGALGAQGGWIGTLFLGSMSLGFWVLLFTSRERWWAIIPGGILLSVAAMPLVAEQFSSQAVVATLFFGMALTFCLVYLLSAPGRHMKWALIPAGIFALMGTLFMIAFSAAINYVWAVALILAGLYLLYYRSRGGQTAGRH